MKEINVSTSKEDCPFSYTEYYVMSEYTVDEEVLCNILLESCPGLGKKQCPLKDQDILVKSGLEKSK